jgi:hypothetical protein
MALVKAPMATMTANVAIVETRALRVEDSTIAEQKMCKEWTNQAEAES